VIGDVTLALDAHQLNHVWRKYHLVKAQSKAMQDIKKEKKNHHYMGPWSREIPQNYFLRIVLSFNVRGVEGARKNIVLKWFIQSHKPDIILIQKSMVDGVIARFLLEPWLKSWFFFTLDENGRLGSFLMGWSPACKV
jgi:hypothetical protein